MTFGDAITALKYGRKVARKGWNGKGMFLWLKPGDDVIYSARASRGPGPRWADALVEAARQLEIYG